MTAILGDVRLDRRQLGDLMAPRLADTVLRGQRVLALTTRVRHEIDDRIHALDGHQWAMVSRMPGLTAGRAPTLRATPTHTWPAREAIGGRRFRGRRGILLPERELAFQIHDPFRLLGELFAETLVLPLQSFNLLRRAIARVAGGFSA